MKKEKDSQNLISTYITNWLDNRPQLLIRLTILLALFSFSCEEPIETSELELVPNKDDLTIRFVEIPLSVTQAAFDTSVVSSNNTLGATQQVFFGKNTDSYIGTTTASAYVGLLLESGFVRDSLELSADLIGSNLVMRFSNLYGDEFQTGQDIIVEQLADTISLHPTAIYKLSDEIPTEPVRVSKVNNTKLFPNLHNPSETPDSISAIRAPLTEAFGIKVLNALRDEDLSASELAEELAGLKISTDGSFNAMQGLELQSSKSYLELVYQNDAGEEYDTVKFFFSKSSFTHVDFEPSGIMPSDYSANRDFQLTDPSKIYFNGMLSIFPKVNINAYFNFIDTIDYMLIDHAELVVSNQDLDEFSTQSQAKLIPSTLLPYYIEDEKILKVGEFFWGIQNNFNSTGQIADQSSPFNLASLNYNSSANELAGDVSFFLQELYQNPAFWNDNREVLLNAQFININDKPFDSRATLQMRSFRKFLINESDFKLKIYYSTFEN